MGLYEKALVAVDTEAVFNVAETLDVATDSLLVEDPVFSVNAQILDRTNTKNHLSQDPGSPGRKIAQLTFRHEVRGNGITDGSTPALLGRLFRSCGMSQTAIVAGAQTILDGGGTTGSYKPTNINSPTGRWLFAKKTGYAGTLPRVVEITVLAGGATVSVFSPAVGVGGSVQAQYSVASAAFVNGTDLALPDSAVITPNSIVGAATGDTYIILLVPPGHLYEPISSFTAAHTSATIRVWYDVEGGAIRHEMTGARGTWSMEAVANDFARYTFTFTGSYVDPVDTTFPTGVVYEDEIPPQVELAALAAGGGLDDVQFNLCAQQFTFDIANEVQPRECVNAADSYEGSIITGRNPVAGFNPEAVLEATHPFWGNLTNARKVAFAARVGSEQGNCTLFWAPYAQYSNMPYVNRTGIRAYDVPMRLNTDIDNGGDGNDEISVYIC